MRKPSRTIYLQCAAGPLCALAMLLCAAGVAQAGQDGSPQLPCGNEFNRVGSGVPLSGFDRQNDANEIIRVDKVVPGPSEAPVGYILFINLGWAYYEPATGLSSMQLADEKALLRRTELAKDLGADFDGFMAEGDGIARLYDPGSLRAAGVPIFPCTVLHGPGSP